MQDPKINKLRTLEKILGDHASHVTQKLFFVTHMVNNQCTN